jgi:ABC-type spermidine/putrescine transport system permease subunit II
LNELKEKNVLNKILVIVGTVLVWLPIAAPLLLGLLHSLRSGRLLIDFLMPAELLPVVLLGSGLLLWAAFRVRAYHKLIGWALGIGLAALVISQAIAVVTGLASGEIEQTGWQFVLVLSIFSLYDLCVVIIGVGGILLWRRLVQRAD